MPLEIKSLREVRPNVTITPQYNVPGLAALGKYDAGLRQELNQEFNRADNQGFLSSLANGFFSRGLSIGTKFGSGVGTVGALPQVLTGDKGLEYLWENSLSEAFNDVDEQLRQNLPVYGSKGYTGQGLYSKLGTEKFWLEDGFDGLAYLASAYLGGGAAKLGTSLLKSGLTSLGKNVAKEGLKKIGKTYIGKVASKAGEKISKYGDDALTTLYNTTTEAAMEAGETQKQVKLALQQLKKDNPNYSHFTDEEINLKAAQAAKQTFGLNAAALLVPNYIQSRWFNAATPDKFKMLRESIWENGGKASLEKLGSKAFRKEVLKGFASEGLWEENIQTAIQQYEKRMATSPDKELKYSLADKELYTNLGMQYAKGLAGFGKSLLPFVETDMEDEESAVSILLGGMIGGGMGVMSSVRERSAMNAAAKQEEGRYSYLFNTLGQAAMNTLRDEISSIYATSGKKKVKVGEEEVEVPNFILDDNGKLVKDEQAIFNIFLNQMRDKKLFDASMAAAFMGDSVMDDYNKEMGLAAYAFKLFTKGYSAQEIDKYLSSVSEDNSETSKELGIETLVKDNISKLKQYHTVIENLSKENTLPLDKQDDLHERSFNDFYLKTKFYLDIKRKALQQAKISDEQKSSVLEDLDNIEELLKAKSKVREEYFKTVVPARNVLSEYNALETRKNRTAEEEERLGKLNYLLLEDLAVNGKFSSVNNAPVDLTIGLTNSELKLADPINKQGTGLRYNHYSKLGKQTIALKAAKEEMDAGKDPLVVIGQVLSNAYVIDDELQGFLDTQKDYLINEEERINSVVEDLTKTAAEIEDALYEKDLSSLSEGAIDLLEEIEPNLSQDLNRLEELYQDGTLESLVAKDLIPLIQRSKFIKQVQERLNSLVEESLKVNERSKKLLTDNSEQYLQEEYFNLSSGIVAQNILDLFNTNPEEYYDLDRVTRTLQILNQAKLVFSDRNNKEVNDLIEGYIKQLNDIIPQIIKNRSSKRVKQVEISNRMTSAIMDNIDMKLFEEVLGKEAMVKAVQELYEDNESLLSYSAALTLLSTFKEKATPEQLKKFEDSLYLSLNKYSKELEDLFVKLGVTPFANYFVQKSAAKPTLYSTNPETAFFTAFRNIVNKYTQEDSLGFKYLYDRDLSSLVANIQTDPYFTNEEKNIIPQLYAVHTNALMISKIINLFLKSNFKISDTLSALTVDDKSIKPTPQQTIVLSDALAHYYKEGKIPHSNGEGWMLVQGYAGSGKSFVIGKLLVGLLNSINPINVYAFSNTKFTSDNINKAIFGTTNNSSLDNFLAMSEQELSKIDLVVIDEIFTLPESKIEEIRSKLRKLYENTNKFTKVIILGDASQLSEDDSNNHKLLNAHFKNLTRTIPLTVSYRTSVGIISTFLSNFQMNPNEVTSAFAQANMPLEEVALDPSKAIGIHSMDLNNLLELLNKDSSRTRALIVATQEEVNQLKSKVPSNVDVLTVAESQGYQWDEVYTYLDPLKIGDTNIVRNKAYYTAYSRAKSYLAVVGNIPNIAPDPALNNTIEESAKDLEANAIDYEFNISTAKTVLGILTGAVVPSKPAVTPTPVPVVTDSEESFDAPPVLEEPIIPLPEEEPEVEDPTVDIIPSEDKDSYAFKYPTNYNLNAKMDANAPLHVVRSVDTKGTPYYHVFAKKASSDEYVEIAMLSNAEFTDPQLGSYFTAMGSNKPQVAFPKDAIQKKSANKIDMNVYSVGTLQLAEYKSLKNLFHPEHQESPNLLSNIIKSFVDSYFGTDEDGVTIHPASMLQIDNVTGLPKVDVNGNLLLDYTKAWVINNKINWDVVKSHVSVKIFTRRNKPDGVLAGLPYLEIRDPSQAGKKSNAAKNFYIPLQPKKFSNSSPLYAPIAELYNTLASLAEKYPELTLGSEELELAVRNHAATNYKVTVVDKFSSKPEQRYRVEKIGTDQDPELDKYLSNLVDLLYGPDMKTKFVSSEDEAKALIGQVIEGNQVAGYDAVGNNFMLRYVSDTEGNTSPLKVSAMRSGRGRAQKALNSLAQANQYIRIGETKAEIRMTEDTGSFKLTRAKNVLSTKSYIDYETMYQDHPEWEVNMNMFNSKQHLRNHLIKHGKVTAIDFDKIVREYTLPSWNMGMLMAIVYPFNEKGEHDAEGAYLRTPLNMEKINKLGSDLSDNANRNELNNLLRSRYKSTQRTQVRVTKPSTEQTIDNSFPTRKLKSELRRLQDTVSAESLPIFNLLVNKGIDTTIEYDALPALGKNKGGGFDNNTKVIKFNFSEYTGDFLLHEALHANLNAAITLGFALKEGRERNLYEVISTLTNEVKKDKNHKKYIQDTISKFDEFEFVANLGNPKFIQYLKSKKIEKTSLLNKVISAILDFFGVDSNYYDVAFKAIEDYFDNVQVKSNPELDIYKSKFRDFIKQIKELGGDVSTFSEYYTDDFTPKFNQLTIDGQINYIKELLGEDTAPISYAVFSPPPVVTLGMQGSLLSTNGANMLIKGFISETKDDLINNIISSVISYQITNLDSKMLSNLFTIEDPETLLEVISPIITKSDKKLIDVAYPNINEKLLEAIQVIKAKQSTLQDLVLSADNFSIRRYELAFNYIMDRIEANAKTNDSLVKTKTELISEIFNNLDEDIRAAATKVQSLIIAANLKLSLKDYTAARNILTTSLVEAQNNYAALQSMKSTNKNSGRYFFYDVLADIYPKTKIQDDEDIEMYESLLETQETTNTREDEETKGINEHIKKYNKSQELTLSESIKDMLALVKANGKRLNPSFVYIKSLQLIEYIDNTTLDNTILELNDVISDPGISDVDRAIYMNILNLINTARYDRDTITGIEFPSNVGIVSNTDEVGNVYYKVGLTPDAINMTESQLDALGLSSPKFYSTAEMMKYLASKNVVLSISQFNGLYRKAEAMNTLRELHNLMFSMKEAELMIGTRENSRGMEVAYIVSKATGVSNAVRDSIVEALQKLYLDGKLKNLNTHFRSIYKESSDIINKTTTGGTTDEIRQAIKDFFNMLELNDLAANMVIKKGEVENLREAIKFLIAETANIKNNIPLAEDVLETYPEGSFEWFLENYKGRITDFSNAISKSSEFLRNPSVMTASGEKYYKYHESSFFYDTLYNLIRMHSNPKFKGTSASGSKIRKVPSYLQTSTFKHNIFTTGLSSIKFLAEHEALKNTLNDSVTPYTRESKWHYFHREFLLGFMDGVRQSKGKDFYLFTYTPSDKPKTPLARVSLLSDNTPSEGKSQLDQALNSALDYFIDRKGIKLHIAHFNNSMQNDEYRNFKVIEQAEQNLGIKLNASNKAQFIVEINKIFEQEALKLAKELVDVEFTLDINFKSNIVDNLLPNEKSSSKLNNKYDPASIKDQDYRTRNYSNGESTYAVTPELLLPIVELYLKNHYLNSFFLHHFVAGDYASYKGTSSEVVKRMAGVLAPGIRPLVDAKIGMKEKFKVLVLQDTSESVSNTRDRLKSLFFKDVPENSVEGQRISKELDELMTLFGKYDIADAQGFMLPSRKYELEKGFGRSWGMGNVHKPVHFQLTEHTTIKEDGSPYTVTVPVYLKYSSIVLTDDLISRFPSLAKIRTQLEKSGAQELIMHTGVKTGIPMVTKQDGTTLGKNFSYTIDEFLNLEDPTFSDHLVSPIIELDNRHYRLQHNPAGDPNKNVSIFTQLMYFINAYENTFDVARTNYSLVGELIKMGSDEFFSQFKTESDVKRFLMKKFKGPGSERALELLKGGVSINNPILENKAIISLVSGVEAATVKIKFKGGKLVLQTAQGITKYQDPSTFDTTSIQDQELSYIRKTVNGKDVIMAEAIVPTALLTPEQLKAVKEGRDLFLHSDMMGFRIPSSELHSAVALKVVGVYDNLNTNVIIAPKELVAIHGSDGLKSLLLVTVIENFFNCGEVLYTFIR